MMSVIDIVTTVITVTTVVTLTVIIPVTFTSLCCSTNTSLSVHKIKMVSRHFTAPPAQAMSKSQLSSSNTAQISSHEVRFPAFFPSFSLFSRLFHPFSYFADTLFQIGVEGRLFILRHVVATWR